MLTAQDVRVVTFDKTMRGYNTEDVDAFLGQAADQMDAMQNEKAEMEKKLYMLAEKVAEYRKDENSLKAALLNAQRLGEKVIEEANQRADRILREANGKAEAAQADNERRIEAQKLELERIQEEVARFKSNVLDLYRQHIESLSTLPGWEEPKDGASMPENENLHAEPAVEADALTAPHAAEPNARGDVFEMAAGTQN